MKPHSLQSGLLLSLCLTLSLSLSPLIAQNNFLQSKLLNDTTGIQGDRFGDAVAIDSLYCVVGAWHNDLFGDRAGAAYIFKDTTGKHDWALLRRLEPSVAEAFDKLGISADMDLPYVIVGAEAGQALNKDGEAFIFKMDEGGTDNWGQVARLPRGPGQVENDYFGISVAIDGDFAMVGARRASDSCTGVETVGAVYFYEKNKGGLENWGRLPALCSHFGPNESETGYGGSLGRTVDIDGDFAVAGSTGNAGADGFIRIFYKDQGGANAWGEVATFIGPSGSYGNRVAIWGNYVAVGAPSIERPIGSNEGVVYIYKKGDTPADWSLLKIVYPIPPDLGRGFGDRISIYNGYLLVGAENEFPGEAYLFYKNQGGLDNWGEITPKIKANSGPSGGSFGGAVHMNGQRMIIGAPTGRSPLTDDGSGIAYTFQENTCPESRALQDTIYTGYYAAEQDIIATCTILDSNAVVAEAGDSLLLMNGFYARAGSQFIGRIASCQSPAFFHAGAEAGPHHIEFSDRSYRFPEATLRVYPNPANELINIQLHSRQKGRAVLSLVHASGKVVNSLVLEMPKETTITKTWTVSQLPLGMYFVHFRSAGHQQVIPIVISPGAGR